MNEVVQVDVTGMAMDEQKIVMRESCDLALFEHHDDCPVRHGASVDCVWPLAVCVYREVADRYHWPYEAPSPSPASALAKSAP